MAEKGGGKGYSAAAKGKSVASKQGSFEGRQNNSFNNSIHVEIDSGSDSEGFIEELTPVSSKSNGKAAFDLKSSSTKFSAESLKTGGKASSLSKGQVGKGGKGFSAGKSGGKGSSRAAKPSKSDAELKLELDIPKNSRVLMNCEVAELLQEIHEHMAILSEDPKIKIPESFDKAFQYAKDGNHFSDAKSVKQVLEPLKNCGVDDGEICLIANICPETVEEVYALVPSLKENRPKNEEAVMEALHGLSELKSSK